MTQALLYHSEHKWRFGAALAAAAVIHLAAITFAKVRTPTPVGAPDGSYEPTILIVEPESPVAPPIDTPEPLPSPPAIDETFQDAPSPRLAVRQQPTVAPLVRSRSSVPGRVNVSTAKVVAISAPRPEYPYEARRQKITGEGVVEMTVDPASGAVSRVAITKSTGSSFLDNAAVTGFRRWRFKPGTVSSVVCPVTFTLTGASY